MQPCNNAISAAAFPNGTFVSYVVTGPGSGRGVPRPSGRETRDLASGRAAQRAGIQCRAQTQGGGLILPLAPSSKHQQEARSGIFGAAACTPYRRGDEIGEPPVWITAGWRIARHSDPRDKGSVYGVKRGGRSENMAYILGCTPCYSGFRVAKRIWLINCREALGFEQSGVHPVAVEAIRRLAAL
jgi:hypothetical protein